MHNGIIENYALLKVKLIKEGYVFRSDTDTEVVAHLIASFYKGDMLVALRKALKLVTGSYALAIMHKDAPGKIYVARKDSPLVLGVVKGKLCRFRYIGYRRAYKKSYIS